MKIIQILRIIMYRYGQSNAVFKAKITVFFTCLSKGSKGQRQLVFALRQECYGDATADALHLVGMLAELADGPENPPHPPPVLLLGTKLTEIRKAGLSTMTY